MCIPRASYLHAVSLALAFLPAVDALGGTAPVDYRLLLGSTFEDDCGNCERPVFLESLTGGFTATRVKPSTLDLEVFNITNVDLRSNHPGGGHVITGQGTYRIDTRIGKHEMTLDLEVDGRGPVTLSSGSVERAEPSDTIDIMVGEDGTRDPFHVFSMHIIAAPAPTKAVPYELMAGSKVFIDCFLCELVNPEPAIRGSFLLETLSTGANPVASFRIWDLSFRTEDGSFEGVGNGVYHQGGEVAITQSLELDAKWVDDTLPTHLEKSPGPVPAPFPAIDIEARRAREPGGAGPIFIQGLRIVAQPSSERVLYRRGDSNADGDTNISDAVYILLWRFAGGETPSCLDAADVNDDEKHDITDAVFLLNFLFQGGPMPPAPGSAVCGSAPAPSQGCSAYPAC